MIGVKFNGRLGNQLFQFTFLRYLKSLSKHQIFFFPNPHHAYFAKYFDLGVFNNLTLNSKLYSVLMRIIPKALKFREVYIQNIQVPKPVEIKNNTIYTGFFQTDWYLNQTPDKLQLKLKKKYIDQFRNLYGDIFNQNKTIAVHIRRTDYLNYGKRDISLPIEYFKNRLNGISDLSSYRVFFLSDDINFVKKEFDVKENFIFSENSEIIDFQIIKNADIAIISNSSFSWWASYLSEKQNKVYAPKNWLGFRLNKEHPKGIMTKKFIWCDVIEDVI